MELTEQIKDDIKKKGYAEVPIGIFRGLWAGLDERSFLASGTLLDFAQANGWDLKIASEAPGDRVIFSPLENEPSSTI